jgi:hypothetical protein
MNRTAPLHKLLFTIVLLCPGLTVSLLGQTNFFYVATNGNDAWSGTLVQPNGSLTDGPKASLQGARDAVRTRLAQPGYRWPTIVQIATGTYAMTNALALGLSDSAGATNPVVYQAATGAQPVFTAGRRITGWTPGTNGLWTAFVPGAANNTNYFEQLFIDGRRATRARSPNTDYYYTQAVDPVLTNRAFKGYAADVAPLAILTPTEFSNATVVVYHQWETSRHRLQSLDASNLVTFTGTARWAFFTGQRYQVENIPAALDEPGEWFLARNGILTYWPLPGEDMNTAEVIAPTLTDRFINITGDSTNALYVQYLTFRGLSFQYGRYLLPAAGHAVNQAESDLAAVITLNGTRNIAFEDCEVAHIGLHAIRIQKGCRNCAVTRCYLHDLGGGGVYIGETSQQANSNHRTTFNTVDNNIIRAGGRIHTGAIGVWIGHSSDNSVTHNDISDLYYSAVSVGWTWGYGTSIATNNHVDGNHLHHLGWGVLSDMGAVYTLGISPGTTVSQNYAHHISCYSYGGWGLYNDEGSSGILVASNLVHDTKDGGYHQNYGETNTIRNNIFAHGIDAQVRRSRTETNQHISFRFQNNIVYWPAGALLDGSWVDATNFVLSSNLYWQLSSTNLSFSGNTLAQWQSLGQDMGSRIADPLFRDGLNRDFRFTSTSAVATIGFQPFDFTNAGVYGSAAWRAKAQWPSKPAALPRPVSWAPFNYNDDFEADPIGAALPNASVSGVSSGASIRVVTNNPANGLRCLAVNDASGQAYTYYPFFYYITPDLTGSLYNSFNIRLAADSKMYHEWRDDTDGSYLTGPSVKFDALQMKVGSSVLTTVPSNQWLRVEIYASTTNYATKGWRLGLTKPSQATQWWTNYPSGSNTNWNRMKWLGWVSDATNATTFYLDDLVMTNPPSFWATNPQPPAPIISGLTDRTLTANTSTGPLAFTVKDPETPASQLALSISSSNPRLVPASNLALAGSGTNRTLTITPDTDQTGVTTISVLADNGWFQTTTSFQLRVTNVIVPPLPFDFWRTNIFTPAQLTNAAISAATADPNSNGLPNLLEYALGLNPLINVTNGLPSYSLSNKVLSFRFTRLRDATDITYHMVMVPTLATNTWLEYWSSATNAYPGSASNITQEVSVSTTNQSAGFYRLKITQP